MCAKLKLIFELCKREPLKFFILFSSMAPWGNNRLVSLLHGLCVRLRCGETNVKNTKSKCFNKC